MASVVLMTNSGKGWIWFQCAQCGREFQGRVPSCTRCGDSRILWRSTENNDVPEVLDLPSGFAPTPRATSLPKPAGALEAPISRSTAAASQLGRPAQIRQKLPTGKSTVAELDKLLAERKGKK